MAETAPDSNSNLFKIFRDALAGRSPDDPWFLDFLPQLAEQNLLESALTEFKRSCPRAGNSDPWHSLRSALNEAVQKSRQQRMQSWQLDPRRRTLRAQMEIRRPACNLHPPALQMALARALQDSGLPLAMGLEKTPRPMVRLGHPLPLGVEGLGEWADISFYEPTALHGVELADRINGYCPEGLRISRIESISNHASPVLDLCREARWTWVCPAEHQAPSIERWSRFMAADSFEMEKTGKIAGHKQTKHIEIRHLVVRSQWDDRTLSFTTQLSVGGALNPVKMLAGILEWEPSAITGLTRVGVDLAEDPRLKRPEKYEPKLHNIFEDAVLLESGSNIRIIDDDDDDPILLRREDR